MQCTNCNHPLRQNDQFCGNCGTKIERVDATPNTHKSNDFCSYCGHRVGRNERRCLHCGAMIEPTSIQHDQAPTSASKSKIAAGLLGIFLGAFGIHNFYLGYTGKGVAQLLLTIFGSIILIGPMIAGIWGLVEGIMILTGTIDRDASGAPLKD